MDEQRVNRRELGVQMSPPVFQMHGQHLIPFPADLRQPVLQHITFTPTDLIHELDSNVPVGSVV